MIARRESTQDSQTTSDGRKWRLNTNTLVVGKGREGESDLAGVYIILYPPAKLVPHPFVVLSIRSTLSLQFCELYILLRSFQYCYIRLVYQFRHLHLSRPELDTTKLPLFNMLSQTILVALFAALTEAR